MTPFYAEGPLAQHLDRFAGRTVEALEAFRSLVDGVAELDRQGIVHRDIKPENIFVEGDKLTLGDFGIAYVDDAGKTRESDTYENVGSRDWMPAWAMGMRVADVRAQFDVFTLGKVLWAMVSGRTKLLLWYWDRPEFNLSTQFPTDERIPWINRLLSGSVRQEEEDTWPSAKEFLAQVDSVLLLLRRGGQVIANNIRRACRVCGNGFYELFVSEKSTASLSNFGLNPTGQSPRIFQCGNCGHLDFFRVTAPAWRALE